MNGDFSKIICNEHARSLLASLIREDKLSHAYILHGPDGSGKRTFAKLIAAAAECANRHEKGFPLPCEKCPSCEKILSENAVDVKYISRQPGKASITVSQIRELQSDVSLSATEQKNKIYVIEEAHLMNEQAQNAFLTTLEEPPENVLFLLLSENNDALLETIKSRAQTIPMEKIPDEKMRDHLVKISPKARSLSASDGDSLSEIIVSSGGCIGRALSFIETKEGKALFARRTAATEFLSCCLDRRKKAELVALFSSLSQKKREELTELFSLVFEALRDLAVIKKSDGGKNVFFASDDEAAKFLEFTSLGGIFTMSDATKNAMAALSSNANVQITLSNLLVELQKKQY